MTTLRGSTTLLAALMGASCTPPDDGAAPASGDAFADALPSDAISGSLALVDSVLHFVPCGATTGNAVADLPDGEAATLLAEFAPADGRITAVVRIANDSLREIRYAGLEGPSCTDLPPAGHLEARGQEPFWHVVVWGDSAVASSPELPAGIRYGDGQWERRDSTEWYFDAFGPTGDTLGIVLQAGRCADAMSGARYPWRARLQWRGSSMEGCALEGRGA